MPPRDGARGLTAGIGAGLALLVLFAGGTTVATQNTDPRATWKEPQPAFRIFGNTYYVGTRGLTSILVTSDEGHVLLDGALAETVEAIANNVKRLGFRLEDIELIVNSHAHYDHAAGIAGLQRLSGAAVAALAPSARVLEDGREGADDPQHGGLPAMTPVPNVRVLTDGEVVRVGPLQLTAHATGGHTPGGTSWTWRSCEADRCLDIVYADSITAVSAEGFSFSRSATYPTVLDDFARSFAFLEATPCDILITPHPEASDLWGRLAKREAGNADALVNRTACRAYASAGRERLKARLEREGTRR